MLKAGSVKSKPSAEAWPRQAKPVTPSSLPSECPYGNDTDDYQQVPSYKASLSDAIQAALDSYDQTAGKHGSVQQILFDQGAPWSWNLGRSFSRPVKSWKIVKVMEWHEKSWKMIIMSCNFLQKLQELKNSE